MKNINQHIIKEIEKVSDDLQITKKDAAETLLRIFNDDGLLSSAAQVQMYLDRLQD
mgnify:CR=1 FL=1